MKLATLIARIGLILIVLLTISTAAYAAAQFGAASGPNWTRPGYQFTVPVTQLTNPDKSICLSYSVNGTAQTPVLCTCSGTNCPGGSNATYTCTIATNSSSATIAWDISAFTANNGCSGTKTLGPTGSFTTGPTAVALTAFDVSPQPTPWLLPIALILVAGMTILYVRRRHTP